VLKHLFTVVDGFNLFFTLVALVIALYLYPRSPRAKLTTIAYLPIAIGFVAILLRNMNLIANYPIINHAVMAGFIIQVLIFTIGFARWHQFMESEREVLQYKLAIERSEKELAVQRAEQRVKDSIARDLHDDVAASMSGIRILSQVASKQFAAKVPEASALLEQITRSAQSTLDSIGDLIWAVKPTPDYLNDLADRMREYAATVLEAKNIDYEIRIPRNLPTLQPDIEARRNLYLIFKEAVNNAVKYSQCKSIDICLTLTDNRLEMCVCDDGVGFPREGIREGNGIPNMHKRAKDLGGTLQLIVKDKGVRVQFSMELPVEAKSEKLVAKK
jgi:signal transduction histidine kinase